MVRYKQSIRIRRRYQRVSVYNKVYFEVDTIVINEGVDKITLPDVINSKILNYSHWKDIILLCGLDYIQCIAIENNKRRLCNALMRPSIILTERKV